MKKRFFSLILSIAAVLCGIFAFSACDKTEKEPATEENGLSFQTLTVDGTNVYGKVSNATETFSFLNEVTARGNSKFTVALDIYGTQSVVTKTIPLAVGDNTAYIMETLDGEPVQIYTVTVRRRPIYTVSFDTIGGTAVQSQQVEEDSLATEPDGIPSKPNCTFEEWNYDFSQTVTGDTVIAAKWNEILFTLNKNGDTIIGLTNYGKNKTELIIPSEIDGVKITAIGDFAFYNCTSLESVTILDSVMSIGQGAFHRCTALTSVTIPNGVTSIGVRTFFLCSSLTSITIPNSVTSIGEQAFYDCTKLEKINFNGTKEEWSTIKKSASGLEQVRITCTDGTVIW